MNTNRTRKNGWNEVINAYMGRLPANWPYQSIVVDPRIKTTIREKNARLLNAKLQGRLVPREGGDIIKARINNAVLDFQWDNANKGGSMLEKVANADQITRLFGSSYGWVYWDSERNTNELKIVDPRDIWWDGGATHALNAEWVHIREWTTLETLKARGYNVKELTDRVKNGDVYNNDLRSTAYESIEKTNRFIEDRLGQDPFQSTIEIVSEWHKDSLTVFSPKHRLILKDGPNPYKHQKIPVAQLRYYPLGDNMIGDSEVEAVLPLFRAINATLCAYIDEMNIAMRPPLKITSAGVRMETIEYGPGAKWIMNNIENVQELSLGQGAIEHFHETYPALVAAFNTAMGSQSLGVSNIGGAFQDKTATEVRDLQSQSNTMDQSNQNYLGEFLKEIMMMWLSNNKQYIFDDPTKLNYIQKIVGKDQIQQFQQLGLSETDIPPGAMNDIAQTIAQNPGAVSQQQLNSITSDVSIPKHPIVMNPNEKDPTKYEIKPKLDVQGNGEANLYITPDDFEGEYDYIPDVRSMASGAGAMMQQARDKALEMATNPVVQANLQTAGYTLKMKDILENTFEDAGYKDAESLFQPINPGGGASSPNQPGSGATGNTRDYVNLNFKDLPQAGQIQAAAQVGIKLDPRDFGAGLAPTGANPNGLPSGGGLPAISQAPTLTSQLAGLSQPGGQG